MRKITEKKTINLLEIIKGIILFVVIIMPLIHVFYENKPKKLAENKLEYRTLLKERDSIEKSLFLMLNSDILSKESFTKKFNENKLAYKKKIKQCNIDKRKILKEFSFNGRNSFHYWLFVFGLSFSFCFLAIRYTFRIIQDSKDHYLRKSQILEASCWIGISLFWVFHSLFIKKADLPTLSYAITMFVISVIIGLSIFYLIKHLASKKNTLRSYKESIINLISLIADIKVDHYFKMATKAITKDNEEEINKDAELLDNKIFSTLDKVTDESK